MSLLCNPKLFATKTYMLVLPTSANSHPGWCNLGGSYLDGYRECRYVCSCYSCASVSESIMGITNYIDTVLWQFETIQNRSTLQQSVSSRSKSGLRSCSYKIKKTESKAIQGMQSNQRLHRLVRDIFVETFGDSTWYHQQRLIQQACLETSLTVFFSCDPLFMIDK